jgi:hypothetical protein
VKASSIGRLAVVRAEPVASLAPLGESLLAALGACPKYKGPALDDASSVFCVPLAAFGRPVPCFGGLHNLLNVFQIDRPQFAVMGEVVEPWDTLKVLNRVVSGVAVLMMDVITLWNLAIVRDPNVSMEVATLPVLVGAKVHPV